MISNVYDRIVKFHFELDMVSGGFRCDFSIIFVVRTKKYTWLIQLYIYNSSIKMNNTKHSFLDQYQQNCVRNNPKILL